MAVLTSYSIHYTKLYADHSILREGLRLLIAPQADMEVVGEACDGFETLEKARKLQPQVIVIDIAMPRMNGIETISLLKDCCPDCRTVVLSGYEKDAYRNNFV